LLVSLDPFCFGPFGDFIPKGENMGPKQCVNIGREDQKGEV
jgi:hypothetical protein